jgi:tRNA (guanine37-N1)-methyltransferase
MKIDVFTLFPDMVDAPLALSIVGRARSTGALDLRIHDIRNWTNDVHRTADDSPYGGGAGMVMKADPIVRGVEEVIESVATKPRILILSAGGPLFTQTTAVDLAAEAHLILVAGHYEGIDDRVRQLLEAEELSIGDYVLTGGELAAAVVIDTIARLLPGVINAESTRSESHGSEIGGLVEYPQFTRPAIYRGLTVPDVLLSGNHAAIAQWREEESVAKTRRNRPELLSPEAATSNATERPDTTSWPKTID